MTAAQLHLCRGENRSPIFLAMILAQVISNGSRSVVWSVGRLYRYFGPNRNISTTIAWIAVTFCEDINGPQRLNPNDFSKP